MYLTTTNKKENFKIELMSGNFDHNPPESEDFYYVTIYEPLTQEQMNAIVTSREPIDPKQIKMAIAQFYNLEDAKEVYFSFINWSIKGMHTFEQRALLLKELEKYYKNKTKYTS